MFEAAPLFQAETTAAAFGCARRVWFTCALAAAVLVLGGCFRKFHLRLPVTIEVVDGLTGLPVEGAFISQGKTVGKFDPKIDRSVATTGPDGTARFVVLCWMDGTYWQIFAGDPMLPDNLKTEGGRFFNGRGFSQIPPEFTELSKDYYRAPLWPPLSIVIDLPPDFIGMVAEVKLDEDSKGGAGWKPPLIVSEGMRRRARVRPDAHGVVSYPGTIDGVKGFDFQAGRGFRRNEQWLEQVGPWDSLVKRRGYIDEKPVLVPIDELEVRAWRIALEEYPDESPNVTRVFFIGSLIDLRAWIVASAVEPSKHERLKYEPADIAAFRLFDAQSVLKLVAAAEPVIPEWTEIAQYRYQDRHTLPPAAVVAPARATPTASSPPTAAAESASTAGASKTP